MPSTARSRPKVRVAPSSLSNGVRIERLAPTHANPSRVHRFMHEDAPDESSRSWKASAVARSFELEKLVEQLLTVAAGETLEAESGQHDRGQDPENNLGMLGPLLDRNDW